MEHPIAAVIKSEKRLATVDRHAVIYRSECLSLAHYRPVTAERVGIDPRRQRQLPPGRDVQGRIITLVIYKEIRGVSRIAGERAIIGSSYLPVYIPPYLAEVERVYRTVVIIVRRIGNQPRGVVHMPYAKIIASPYARHVLLRLRNPVSPVFYIEHRIRQA